MLTEQQLNLFNKNGFLVVDHVLVDEDLLPLQREYAKLLDSLAPELYREGKIDSEFADCSFDERFARSRANPASELSDPLVWNQMWQQARERIISGEYIGPIFKGWMSE